MRLTVKQLKKVIYETITQAKIGISSPYRATPQTGMRCDLCGSTSRADAQIDVDAEGLEKCPSCGTPVEPDNDKLFV